MRKIDAQDVVAFAIGAALVGAIAFAIYDYLLDAEEDRPVIIVHGGSVHFEQSVDWEPDSSDKKKAYPNQPKAWNVKRFEVTFHTDDIKNGTCPQVPLLADRVEFTHKPPLISTVETVSISVGNHGGKKTPAIEAPADLTIDAKDPKKMTHGASGGSITAVTVRYGTSKFTCTPDLDSEFKHPIQIQPVKQ